eukprot:g4856.t1
MLLSRFALVVALQLARGQFGVRVGSTLLDWGIEEEAERDPAQRAWSAPEDLYSYSVEFDSKEPIGLRLSEHLVVTEVVAGSEASKTSIRARDRLLEVNGEKLAGMTLLQAMHKIRDAELPKLLRLRPHVQEHGQREVDAEGNAVVDAALERRRRGSVFTVTFHMDETAHGVELSPELVVTGFRRAGGLGVGAELGVETGTTLTRGAIGMPDNGVGGEVEARASLSPAEACGLIHVGDRLVAVNDVAVAGQPLSRVLRRLDDAFTSEVVVCRGKGDRNRHCAVKKTAAAGAHKRLRFEVGGTVSGTRAAAAAAADAAGAAAGVLVGHGHSTGERGDAAAGNAAEDSLLGGGLPRQIGAGADAGVSARASDDGTAVQRPEPALHRGPFVVGSQERRRREEAQEHGKWYGARTRRGQGYGTSGAHFELERGVLLVGLMADAANDAGVWGEDGGGGGGGDGDSGAVLATVGGGGGAGAHTNARSNATAAVASFPFVKAKFGGELHCDPRPLALPVPASGCGEVQNDAEVRGRVAVVRRGGCFFAEKARNMQEAQAAGVVVVNSEGSALVAMPAGELPVHDLSISAIMVPHAAGAALENLVRQAQAAARDEAKREEGVASIAEDRGDLLKAAEPSALDHDQPHPAALVLPHVQPRADARCVQSMPGGCCAMDR